MEFELQNQYSFVPLEPVNRLWAPKSLRSYDIFIDKEFCIAEAKYAFNVQKAKCKRLVSEPENGIWASIS
jgi:hypothetical protein